MKRGFVFLMIVMLIAATAGGWWWARNFPEQAIQFLVDGGLQASRAEEFILSIGGKVESEEENSLIVSGSIEGEEVSVVSEFGGRIVALDVAEGDQVQAGQLLVSLDTKSLDAQLAQAEAAVAAAEANLDSVRAGTHPAELRAAAAVLLQAATERDAAQADWDSAQAMLKNPQEIKAQIVQAEASVDLADVQIEQAEAQIAAAQVQRDQYRARGSAEEKWLYRIHDYQVEAAQVGLELAKVAKLGANRMVAALKTLRDNPLALVSQVHMAEAQYNIAEAGVAVAEARLAELRSGPTDAQIGVAEAQVAQAKAAVYTLLAQKRKMVLDAPISGVVTSQSAHAGEAVVPGATLLTLANLDEVELTVYIPEDELGAVYLGQMVEVEVDSFPGQVFSGTVSHISQRAEFTPKNVQTQKERVNMVFAVRIRLPNPNHLLKPGMPADALLHDR